MSTDEQVLQRRMAVGAELLPAGGVHFRVWAPSRSAVQVQVEGRSALTLQQEGDGYWAGTHPQASAGDRYRFQLAGEPAALPDPASRFQPEGPHGPSEIVDPGVYEWSDTGWPGIELKGQVLYELHIGTFTPEGTYAAAMRELPRLRALGITVLEVMPLAEAAGRWGWGYDGVDLYAPNHHYGTPNELRALVDAAHAHELGVLLDVVYNHLGPDGNYLHNYSRSYFGGEATEWGEAINFDGEACGPTREFFKENAAYWIREFHFDGLRLDATQSIKDSCGTGKHILQEIGEAARAAAGERSILLVAENEPQHTKLIRPIPEGGYGLDAIWNDDLHHSMMVRLTLRREAYYSDHLGSAQEFVSAARHGFLYQGQHYTWQKACRGTSARGLRPEQFVTFLENHDQVANTDRGLRVRARSHPAVYRAMTAYWLLGPGTPMFFQGQEYGAESPFLYFCDHEGELADLVRKGRGDFLKQFPSLRTDEVQASLPDPNAEETFERSKLRVGQADRSEAVVRLHADLLRLRREDSVLAQQAAYGLDGAVLGEGAFALRWFAADAQDRLLVVNLHLDLELPHTPEPLLASPDGTGWQVAWGSEHPAYGGAGTLHPCGENGWRLPGGSATLLIAS